MSDSVRVQLTPRGESGGLHAEFPIENTPKTASDIVRIIREKSREIPQMLEENLTDEHLFVLELEQALRDFQKTKDVPQYERMTLDQLVLLIEGGKTSHTPERLKELYEFLIKRYPLTSDDVTIEREGGARPPIASVRRAFNEIESGVRDFWQKIYRAILKADYTIKFPQSIRGSVADIVWEEDASVRQQLADQLAKRSLNFSPERNLIFIRAMYEEVFGSIKGTVLSREELKKLAGYLARHSLTAEEVASPDKVTKAVASFERLLLNAVRKSAPRSQRKRVLLITKALERSAQRPEQFLNEQFESSDLFSGDHLYSVLETFSPVQKQLFIAALGERFSQGMAGTIVAFGKLRDIIRVLSVEKKIVRESPTNLRVWCERLADEINEIRTAPESHEATRELPAKPTSRSILEAISVKNARIAQLAHEVARLSVEGRKSVYDEIAKWIVTRDRIKNLIPRLGRTPATHEVDALIRLLEQKGESTHEKAWEILLTVANKYRRFRERATVG